MWIVKIHVEHNPHMIISARLVCAIYLFIALIQHQVNPHAMLTRQVEA